MVRQEATHDGRKADSQASSAVQQRLKGLHESRCQTRNREERHKTVGSYPEPTKQTKEQSASADWKHNYLFALACLPCPQLHLSQ